MKGKVVISGSLSLLEETVYWKKTFENLGYEVINYPHLLEDDIKKEYKKYYEDIKNCDVFFLMNERKGNIEGYIGASVFAELNYAFLFLVPKVPVLCAVEKHLKASLQKNIFGTFIF